MFTVFIGNNIKKQMYKWDSHENILANNIFQKLAVDPFQGRPLNHPQLREKRIRDKRLYYLVFEDLKIVFIVNFSSKKNQQQIINAIKLMISDYRKIAEEISKQLS